MDTTKKGELRASKYRYIVNRQFNRVALLLTIVLNIAGNRFLESSEE